MRFAVVVFACVLAAANAQLAQNNRGQYFPQKDQYQYNRYNNYNNQYNRYNPYNNYNNYNNYNRYQNYNPYKPYVNPTPFPRPAVTIAEAKATVAPAVVPVVTPVVPAVTPVPVVPVAVSVPRIAADDRSAETVKYGNEINPDGTYNYFYETNNGIAAQAQGTPRNFGGNPPVVPDVAQGSFSWISPEGETIAITYVADENGYQPSGAAIPQPPEIPAQIARALEYIARSAPPAPVNNN